MGTRLPVEKMNHDHRTPRDPELPRSAKLLFAELKQVGGFSNSEALRIVCWEESVGTREYSDEQLKKWSDRLNLDQQVRDWQLELKERTRSMRRSSAELAGRYTLPVCRGEASAWLRRNYDAAAKGPRLFHQQKLIDFVSKGVPEERDLESSTLGNMLGALASRVLAPPDPPAEEGELDFH